VRWDPGLVRFVLEALPVEPLALLSLVRIASATVFVVANATPSLLCLSPLPRAIKIVFYNLLASCVTVSKITGKNSFCKFFAIFLKKSPVRMCYKSEKLRTLILTVCVNTHQMYADPYPG
jgi:hypothetical protein